MKFLSIPQNGASWSGPLIYSFHTESDEKQDVDIVIIDDDGVIARKRLYGVVQGEIDIAPILRSVSDMRILPSVQTSVRKSSSARKVTVQIADTVSDPRVFCCFNIEIARSQMLSYMPVLSSIAYGEQIMFSLFAQKDVNIDIEVYAGASSSLKTITYKTDSLPIDVFINTSDFGKNCERIDIAISSQRVVFHRLCYVIGGGATSGRRIVWRNRSGGVESYLFPRCLRLMQEAEVDCLQGLERNYSILSGAKQQYRLCSAHEDEATIKQLAEIMLSPYVYEVCDGQLIDVELCSRSVEYGTHGQLRTIALDICGEWKGGER